MITLNSIRLRNFRGIREATFSPLENGITGLSGNNGSGKSTFQQALLWALYGVRPDNVTTAELRRRNSALVEECSVSAIITHNGQTIEVVRELTGKSNKTLMTIFIDGEVQTHTSVGVAEAWIEDRLGVSAQGFLTAYVIQQKDLDALLSSTPAERRTLIEKFFGIEKTSEALKAARDEAATARKIAAALPGTEEDVDIAQYRADEAYAALVEAQSSIATIRTAMNESQMNLDSLSEAKSEQNSTLSYEQSLRSQLRDNEHKILLAAERKSSIEKLLEGALRRAAGADPESYQKLNQEHFEVSARIDRLNEQKSSFEQEKAGFESTIASLSSRGQNLTRLAEEQKAKLDTATTDVALSGKISKKNYTKHLEEAQRKSASAEAASAGLKDRAERLKRSISLLLQHSSDAQCPTCQTHLDDPSGLIGNLQEEVDTLLVSAQQHDDTITAQEETIHNLRIEQADNEAKIAAKEKAQHVVDNLRRDLEGTTRQVETLGQELSLARAQLAHMTSNFDSAAHKRAFDNAHRKLSEINVVLARLSEARAAGEEAQAHQNSLVQLDAQSQQLDFAAASLEEQLLSVETVSDSQVKELDALVTQAFSEVRSHETALATANGNARGAQARYEALGEASERAQKALDDKRAALRDAETKAAVAALLDSFRRNRISRIAPELSESATALISKATDGYYTEVLIDEQFTPTLINSAGQEVPLSWLSGGETSVVSLALRVSIGDMISGEASNLLWADEIFVSQDAERRAGMLAMVRSLDRQTILVSHTQGAEDIVDELITVVKDDEDGSYIEE